MSSIPSVEKSRKTAAVSPTGDRERSPELRYVITGLGRSGTTFLTHVFHRAGYDVGDARPEEIGVHKPVGGGLEHPPCAQMNARLQLGLSHLWDGMPDAGAWQGEAYGELARRFREWFDQPWPFVLKDPRFLDTARVWHAAGKVPRHVFLCVRHPIDRTTSIEEVAASTPHPGQRVHIERTERSYYSYFSVFDFLLHCEEQSIPVTTVLYPCIASDRAYAEEKLCPFIVDPWRTIRETWDENLMHHSRASDSASAERGLEPAA